MNDLSSDLQYLKDNFTGTYVSTQPNILYNLRQDFAFTQEGCSFMVNRLTKFHTSISPNTNEVELTDNNGRTTTLEMNTVVSDFWFPGFQGQSIARYENYTLIIEMTAQVPTAKRVTFQFYGGPKGIKFEMFNGKTSWTMTYEKVA